MITNEDRKINSAYTNMFVEQDDDTSAEQAKLDIIQNTIQALNDAQTKVKDDGADATAELKKAYGLLKKAMGSEE